MIYHDWWILCYYKRVLAALRTPVFLRFINTRIGRCAPPPPRPSQLRCWIALSIWQRKSVKNPSLISWLMNIVLLAGFGALRTPVFSWLVNTGTGAARPPRPSQLRCWIHSRYMIEKIREKSVKNPRKSYCFFYICSLTIHLKVALWNLNVPYVLMVKLIAPNPPSPIFPFPILPHLIYPSPIPPSRLLVSLIIIALASKATFGRERQTGSTTLILCQFQCCGSGMFIRIPDPTLFHPGSRIPDPNFFHPGYRIGDPQKRI